MVDVGLIGGESVGVTEFRGVEEDAMGRRGGGSGVRGARLGRLRASPDPNS